jgi:hypothetical protein
MAAHSFSSLPVLTVTRARRKRTGVLTDDTSSNAAGVAGHAGPQASDQPPVSGEVGVAHWTRPRTSRSSACWCSGECLDTHTGDVSRVYVAKQRIFLLF